MLMAEQEPYALMVQPDDKAFHCHLRSARIFSIQSAAL